MIMDLDPIKEDEREYIAQVKALEQVESLEAFVQRIVQTLVDNIRRLRWRRFQEALIAAVFHFHH